jgi:hypothetical protein
MRNIVEGPYFHYLVDVGKLPSKYKWFIENQLFCILIFEFVYEDYSKKEEFIFHTFGYENDSKGEVFFFHISGQNGNFILRVFSGYCLKRIVLFRTLEVFVHGV